MTQPPFLSASKCVEFEAFHEQLKEKNTFLLKSRNEIQQETRQLRSRYQELNERLRLLTPALEKNAGIYQQLFNETENSVKICTLKCISYDPNTTSLDNNFPASKTSVQKKSENTINTKSATTPVVVRPGDFRKKFHIEPLNIQDWDQTANESEAEKESTYDIPNRENVEEKPKDLIVRLEQLPDDVLLRHLNKDMFKQDITSSCSDNSYSNITELTNSPSNGIRSFLETLGLSPMTTSPKQTNAVFVSSRRAMRNTSKRFKIKQRPSKSCSPKKSFINNTKPERTSNDLEYIVPSTSQQTSSRAVDEHISPKKRCLFPSPIKNKVGRSPPGSNFPSPIKNKVGRPPRGSKPMKSFKEESLRAKKRQP